MERREILKLLGLAAASLAVPLEFPVKKEIVQEAAKIGLITEDIIQMELNRVMPYLPVLFDRDDVFFAAIKKKD